MSEFTQSLSGFAQIKDAEKLIYCIKTIAQNRRIWRDETDLRAGKPLVSNLFSSIASADTFIAFISNSYLKSKFCMAELEKAIHRKISTGKLRVICLQLDDCEMPNIASTDLWINAPSRNELIIIVNKLIDEEL